MYMQTEILFPPRVIPLLRDASGPEWRKLVDRVAALDETHPESLALSLAMIRLNGCLECETDSFRAMRGCAACALQTVRRFRGSRERELLKAYQAALKDVQAYLTEKQTAKARKVVAPRAAVPANGRASARSKEAAVPLRAG
jgi:hypothetical protein